MEEVIKELGNLIYEIGNVRETINSISKKLEETHQALQLLQPDVSSSLPSDAEMINFLQSIIIFWNHFYIP